MVATGPSAPNWLFAVVLLINTVAVALFQVRLSRGSERSRRRPGRAPRRGGDHRRLRAVRVRLRPPVWGRGPGRAGAAVHVVGEMVASAGSGASRWGWRRGNARGSTKASPAWLRAVGDHRSRRWSRSCASTGAGPAGSSSAASSWPPARSRPGLGVGPAHPRAYGALTTPAEPRPLLRHWSHAQRPARRRPCPADGGAAPGGTRELLGRRPFGIYVHVPFCCVRCGYCDFNTYTLTELGVDGASVATYADAALPSSTSRRRCSGPAPRPCRRSSSAAARPPCWPPATSRGARTASATGSGSPPAPRSRPRPTPTRSRPSRCSGSRTAGSPGSPSACSRRCRTCSRTLERTHDPATSGAPSTRPGPPASKVSLDLIYGTPGESLDDWRASLDAAIALRARPRLGLRAGRRGGHQARRPGAARRGARARGRRRGRQVRARRRAARGGRLRLVRGQQLGPHATRTAAATTWATGPTQLVGRRPRRAQPRRRRALVERQAPQRVCRAARRGASPGRTAARLSPTSSGTTSGCCSACGWSRACDVDDLREGRRPWPA